ncbi:MAG: dynamin family protein [Romboutsia sp.]
MYLSREEERLKMLKIIYELDYNTSKIKEIINEYELKILDNRVRSLVKNIEFQIDKNKDSINELKNPFLLFIVGSGNYGKSTLINTLLNEEIVKTTDLPNTWKIDLFIKSEREKMEITYYDKSVVVKNLKEGNKLLEKEEIKFKESRRKVSKIVNEYKKLNKVDVNILKKYKSNQEEQYLYKSNIAQIKYNIRKGKILEKFIVVDTPGLNQNLLKDTLNRIKEYYIKADGVIWLIDAQNLVSKENNELIKEIKKIDDLNNHNKNKIAVINKMDIIRKVNINNIYKIKEKAYELYKNKFNDIVFISAKEGLQGIVNNDYNLINQSNIKDLFNSIEENFVKISQEKQISSKYKNIEIMKTSIISEIHSYKRQLYKDISQYHEIEFELKEKTERIYNYLSDYTQNLNYREYSNKQGLYELSKNIIELEKICSLNLEKIYQSIYNKFDLLKYNIANNLNTNVYFSKSKHLIFDYNLQIIIDKNTKNNNQIENILKKLTIKNLNNKSHDEILIQNTITQKIHKLNQEIIKALDEKVLEIKNEINIVKNKNFEEKYLNYSKIKLHIEYLNNIESILKKLEV